MKIIITGGAGSVGSNCSEYYANQGHEIISIDNFTRGKLFGNKGNTKINAEVLSKKYKNIKFYNLDILDSKLKKLIQDANLIIHTAAQTSHSKSIEIPKKDFLINAYGTLHLLDLASKYASDSVFIFCSTNKVYGENPNKISLVEKGTRYDYLKIDGINEKMPVDHTLHTPFGASKLAGDIYTQEYGKLYGLKTGIFRMGCITGPFAKAVELQNWVPYFIKKNLNGETINVYGFKGKQVRDVLDTRDLVIAFDNFFKKPKRGEVYNMGGGRKNSISLLESFELIKRITGKPMKYFLKEKRVGDHQVYISDLGKFKKHYPNWGIKRDLFAIFNGLHEEIVKKNNPK